MIVSKKIRFLIITLISGLFVYSCSKSYSPETEKYIKSVELARMHKDSLFEFASGSPFNLKEKVEFHNLNYFDVDTSFIFESKFHTASSKDTLTIYGTKGEARETVRIGYLSFNYANKSINLNVYKSSNENGQSHYGVWFTDKTTNNQTYGVGRYLDFEMADDTNHIYTIDFNLAYNPFCAYSPAYSCAIPTKEDYIGIAIKAGEKKFHE